MEANHPAALLTPAAKTAPVVLALCGLGLAASSILFLLLSHHPLNIPVLGLDPIVWLVGIGMGAGAIYLILCRSIIGQGKREFRLTGAFTWLLLVGLLMRLVLLPSTPMLENDYLRYLWDGSVVAAGQNPFAFAPQSVINGAAPPTLQELGMSSGGLLESVTYPLLRSIYPPVAQASFLLANWLEPWSLMAWRTVIFGFDLVSFGLLLTILRQLALPITWAAIYWCNPLIVKEFFNSAHMDAVLVPFLLAALLLILKNRSGWAASMLAFAAGCKIWPALLMPSLLRPFVQQWRKGVAPLLIFVALATLFSAPVLLAGLNEDSGFVAYGRSWQRNDAVFGVIAWLAGQTLDILSLDFLDAGRVARFAVALVVVATALGINRKDLSEPIDVVHRFLFVAALLFLLSPTQYPWYFSWLLPFLAILPSLPLLLLTALLPLYYLRFYFEASDAGASAETILAWIQFGPVLALLVWQGLTKIRPGSTDAGTAKIKRATAL